jgi:hypothetical protein
VSGRLAREVAVVVVGETRFGLCHTLGGPGIVSCVMVVEAAS